MKALPELSIRRSRCALQPQGDDGGVPACRRVVGRRVFLLGCLFTFLFVVAIEDCGCEQITKLRLPGRKREKTPLLKGGAKKKDTNIGGSNLGGNLLPQIKVSEGKRDVPPRTERRQGAAKPAKPAPIVPAPRVAQPERTNRQTGRSGWSLLKKRRKRTHPLGEPESWWTRFKKGATKRFRSLFGMDRVAKGEARRALTRALNGVNNIRDLVDEQALKQHIQKARKAKKNGEFTTEIRAALTQLDEIILSTTPVNAVRDDLKTALKQAGDEGPVDTRQHRADVEKRIKDVAQTLDLRRWRKSREKSKRKKKFW